MKLFFSCSSICNRCYDRSLQSVFSFSLCEGFFVFFGMHCFPFCSFTDDLFQNGRIDIGELIDIDTSLACFMYPEFIEEAGLIGGSSQTIERHLSLARRESNSKPIEL